MIKFSQKNVEKSDILNLINDETLYIEVHLTFQKKLNEQVLSYLKSFMNENTHANDYEKIDSMSDYLNNASKVLKKSSANLLKFQNLQTKLTSMKKVISELELPSSTFVKTQIEDYNKKYSETLEKTNSATSEIQAFLAQCEQNDILKELLLERELAKKSNEFVSQISDIQILPTPISLSEETSNNSSSEIDISETNIQATEDIYPEISKEEIDENSQNETISESIILENSSNLDLDQSNSNNQTDTNCDSTIESTSTNIQSITTSNISSTEINNDNLNEDSNNSLDEEKIINQLIETSNIVENTLIISEKNGNVILPYTIQDLNSTLKKNPYKYENIEDVIKKKYTKSMKYYKNSSIARFKETFKLVRERSNGSLKHAWDLAIEAFFNYDLHPAIISACKSIDELDIYLSCLEYDELEDFRFFKIIFDVLPTLNKKKKLLA